LEVVDRAPWGAKLEVNDDAVAGKPGERAFQKAGGGLPAFVRQDLAIGEPAGVVDADMQALPTDPMMSIDRAAAAPGDAMADERIRIPPSPTGGCWRPA
jgi:hypothetical protein